MVVQVEARDHKSPRFLIMWWSVQTAAPAMTTSMLAGLWV